MRLRRKENNAFENITIGGLLCFGKIGIVAETIDQEVTIQHLMIPSNATKVRAVRTF